MKLHRISIACLLLACSPIKAAAQTPEWPPELAIASLLVEGAPKFPAWKVSGGTAESIPEGIQVTSEQSNPLLSFEENFGTPVAIQAGILNIAGNDSVRILLAKSVALVFNKQTGKVSVQKVTSEGASTIISEQGWSPFAAPPAPDQPTVVTLVTDGGKLMIWLDGALFYEGGLEEPLGDISVQISGGWMSKWTLASFAAAQLKKMP